MRLFFIVFMGSGMGGALRHLVGLLLLRLLGPSFPYGTLAINVFGSALMGLVVGVLSMRSGTSHELRVFLTTGVIGGFTTWSTFSLDAYSLWERGEPVAATGYVLGSLVLSFTVLTIVLVVARRLG
ncbi:MAG: fluoride efflux transporter CrcB [Sphingopyxis sp.]|nr:fluoride efflux transporter CrcB [Sphingopyxis sp.]TAK06092.1 MAG: fluoride efflux transporter CrcB [Rhizorhabdus sp.]